MLQYCQHLAGQGIESRDAVNLITEEFHTDCLVAGLRREDFQDIAAYAERSPLKLHLRAVILVPDQFMDHLVPVLLHSRPERHHHAFIVNGAAQTVDAGNGGDNDHILSFRKRHSRRQAELIDLVIDVRVFFNIGIRRRNIRLRLIIIVIRDEILHRVLREVFLHLTVQLASQGFIVRNDQGRLFQCRDDVRHRKGLAGAGHPQQGLELIPLKEALRQCLNRFRLVAHGLIWRMKLEFCHSSIP